MTTKILSNPTRRPCVGHLDKRIVISRRRMTAPDFGETNLTEKFPDGRKVWAQVKTVNGRTRFNGVDTDVSLTHEIIIRFDPDVTSESWIQLGDGTRLDIEDVENINEESSYMVLQCRARGTEEASKA